MKVYTILLVKGFAPSVEKVFSTKEKASNYIDELFSEYKKYYPNPIMDKDSYTFVQFSSSERGYSTWLIQVVEKEVE